METQKSPAAIVGVILAVVLLIILAIVVFGQNGAENPANSNNGDAMMEDKMDNNNGDVMMEDDGTTDTMLRDDVINGDVMMDDDMIGGDAMMDAPESMDGDDAGNDATVSTTAGQYVDYSPDAFAAAADKKRVLFFHAKWCPFCRTADAEISGNLGDLPNDTVVFKTDYDTQSELKKKYGVTYQHTFVQVDANGNAITKWTGGGLDEINSNVR